MAKIPTTRLNSAPVVYEQNEFNQLIVDLQDIIKILNTTYPKDPNTPNLSLIHISEPTRPY